MLKMLTGLAAKVLRLGTGEPEALPDAGLKAGVAKALAAITDTEMLNWLDRQSSWRGQVAFRWSTTGRGWRLMEVPDDYPGTLDQEGVVTPPARRVRKAIADAMLMVSPTDTQAIDWLDEQTGSYTGLVIWRLSTRGLGWRLHETSWDGAKATVRETIADAMRSQTAAEAAQHEAWIQATVKEWHGAGAINAAMCRKCGDLVASTHRHHFAECGCGSIAVDGGSDYNRRVGDLGDIGEVPTKRLFKRLAALPAEDRPAEWIRCG